MPIDSNNREYFYDNYAQESDNNRDFIADLSRYVFKLIVVTALALTVVAVIIVHA